MENADAWGDRTIVTFWTDKKFPIASHLTPLANVCIYLPFGCLLFVLSYYIWMVRIIALERKWKYFLLYHRPKLFLRVYKNEGTNKMVEGYICWMGWMARIINDNLSQASQDLSFSTLHHSQAHTGENKMWHCLKFHKYRCHLLCSCWPMTLNTVQTKLVKPTSFLFTERILWNVFQPLMK